MSKGIWIGLIVVASLIAVYFLYSNSEEECPPARNPDKFPVPWKDNAIPHGDLGQLAEKYVNPVLGDDTKTNGSLIGGFFKGINVYPSEAAAKYYRRYLINHLKSDKAIPYWNMSQGELLCQKTV